MPIDPACTIILDEFTFVQRPYTVVGASTKGEGGLGELKRRPRRTDLYHCVASMAISPYNLGNNPASTDESSQIRSDRQRLGPEFKERTSFRRAYFHDLLLHCVAPLKHQHGVKLNTEIGNG